MFTRVFLPKLYRNFAIIFIILAVILAALIAYYTLGRAEIIVTPAYGETKIETIVEIKELQAGAQNNEADVIDGKILAVELEQTGTYETSGSKAVVSDLVGQATLINNYSAKQALVATTRLQAPDGTIVRIKDKTEVPAGGSVKVWVYPDKPEQFSAIQKDTHFIIPGLAKSLQDKIYGENEAELKAGGQTVKTVASADFLKAEQDLMSKITETAIAEFDKQLPSSQSFYSKLVQKEVVEKSFDGAEGDAKDSVAATVKGRIIIIGFDEVKLLNYVKQKIIESLAEGKELQEFDAKSVGYQVENFDIENKTARIKVAASGLSVIKSESDILDKSKVAGKSVEEIEQYFSGLKEIKSVEVEIKPSWFPKAPLNQSKIEIIVR